MSTLGGTPVVTWRVGNLSCSVCPFRGADVVSLALQGSEETLFPYELLHRGISSALQSGGPTADDLVGPPTDPSEWHGHGQTLFPAVGRHKGGVYSHPALLGGAGTTPAPLPMPLHGFALHQPFTVETYPTHAAPSLTCELLGPEHLTPEQRALYPFRFSLRITFTLSHGGLTVTHQVCNRGGAGGEPHPLHLPFALGNHISFALPFFKQTTLSGTCTREHCLAPGSLLSGVVIPRPELSGEGCPLSTPGVLDNVFGQQGGEEEGEGDKEVRREMCLTTRGPGDRGTLKVVVGQRWVPPPPKSDGRKPACDWKALAEHLFFVLWGQSPEEAPQGKAFLCLEPWMGGPDALNTGRCAVLLPGEQLTWEFSVTIAS